jgi:hypothetical protein
VAVGTDKWDKSDIRPKGQDLVMASSSVEELLALETSALDQRDL